MVVARDVAIFLCRGLTKASLDRIGQYFGGRDHTTVMHACRKMEGLVESDPAVRQATEALKRKFS